MEISYDELLLIIGAKEIELFALKRRVAELEAHKCPEQDADSPG